MNTSQLINALSEHNVAAQHLRNRADGFARSLAGLLSTNWDDATKLDSIKHMLASLQEGVADFDKATGA